MGSFFVLDTTTLMALERWRPHVQLLRLQVSMAMMGIFILYILGLKSMSMAKVQCPKTLLEVQNLLALMKVHCPITLFDIARPCERVYVGCMFLKGICRHYRNRFPCLATLFPNATPVLLVGLHALPTHALPTHYFVLPCS